MAGIPKDSIKIVLNRNPAHVALKNNDGIWIEPGEQMDNYISVYQQLAKKNKDFSFWFVLAGLIFQTFMFIILTTALAFFLSRSLAIYMMILSAILTFGYILFDFIMFKTRSVPYGDACVALLMNKSETFFVLLTIVITYLLFFTFI
ncbi:hypothetical protein ACFP65_07820 [Marinilactibacillus sp. GCM10026970]|uniref:hypothetical protein n=1 Tax=Marinilactibacillus sp. GCM10026970 TaxID=3252642 RepID=UPI00361043D3